MSMINTCQNTYNNFKAQHQCYFELYQNFNQKNILGQQYLNRADEKKALSENVRLLYYKGDSKADCVFLVVPSIFNSPEILFLNRGERNFIDYLKQLGDVYLIDWLEVKDADNHSLNEYVIEAVKVIKHLHDKTGNVINLIGNCIGGNIALAAAVLEPKHIKTLTLLTTPWDFSHFSLATLLHKSFNFDGLIGPLSHVPKIYTQILFFLLFPHYFNAKLAKFFTSSGKNRRLFFEVENWLISGHNLPKATYFQLIEKVLTANMFADKQWVINGKTIDPGLFTKPVCQVVAKDDQMVPLSSILPLQRCFKNSILLDTEGGHISYLLDKKKLDRLFGAFADSGIFN